MGRQRGVVKISAIYESSNTLSLFITAARKSRSGSQLVANPHETRLLRAFRRQRPRLYLRALLGDSQNRPCKACPALGACAGKSETA